MATFARLGPIEHHHVEVQRLRTQQAVSWLLDKAGDFGNLAERVVQLALAVIPFFNTEAARHAVNEFTLDLSREAPGDDSDASGVARGIGTSPFIRPQNVQLLQNLRLGSVIAMVVSKALFILPFLTGRVSPWSVVTKCLFVATILTAYGNYSHLRAAEAMLPKAVEPTEE